jgi:putative transposase
VGGVVYHALNRANAGVELFQHAGDYLAFEQILAEAHEQVPMRILSYCLMPNHWHLVLWPHGDQELSLYLRWVSQTHTQRQHAQRGVAGSGHLYQGRFKSFPVEADEHFLTLCRYVERNPLRAGLVSRAEDWQWSSLWRRTHPKADRAPDLSSWPMPCPPQWLTWVNEAQSQAEVDALRGCVKRGTIFGSETWSERFVVRYGYSRAKRPRGRPKKNRV